MLSTVIDVMTCILSDTTAQALAWTFFHLIMNPNLINRIRVEIDEISRLSGSQNVTYNSYQQYVWTQAVIYEALRLHPSIPCVRHIYRF